MIRFDAQRSRGRRLVGIAACALLTAACAGAPPAATLEPAPDPDALVLNTSPPVISNRYRMSPNDIELAILLAIGTPRDVPALEPGQPIADDVVPALLGGKPDGPWSYAGRERGVIYADYDERGVFLHVAITFDSDLVMLSILESRNVGQQGDRIRQRAFAHLGPLESRIRANIEAVAQRNWYGTPVPANQW